MAPNISPKLAKKIVDALKLDDPELLLDIPIVRINEWAEKQLQQKGVSVAELKRLEIADDNNAISQQNIGKLLDIAAEYKPELNVERGT